jgi:hypothetical protein
MGWRERLGNVARNVAGVAGQALVDIADSQFNKADPQAQMVEDQPPGVQNQEADGSVAEAAAAPVPDQPTDAPPKSMFWDPFAVVEQLGYKERPSSISYGTLKAMTYRMPIVQAIIQNRVNQIASFSTPQHNRHQIGFRIAMRDTEAEPMPADRKWIKEMESVLLRTGVINNPRSKGVSPFETFLRKIAWDTLTYDQLTFEIVPNRKGQPAEWYAVDAATFRLADSARAYMKDRIGDEVRYVQIYDGLIVNEYTADELCFGVRNPRTDIRLHGYGTSELEMLITVITALLFAWQYNQNFFTQGSAQKGILNFKGTIPEGQMRAFRRHWYQMLSGIENAWRTPITNAEEVQWIAMQNSNRDMEFNSWMDFQIKICCAMYSMDPVELNFKYGVVGQRSALNEGNNKEKLTESKERGLRPLLRFLAGCINSYIIWPINENFEFQFVGLDALTRQDVAEINMKRVKSVCTVNELRAEDDKPPIEGGDILLDPVYGQFKKAAEAMKQQQEQASQQGMGPEFQVPEQPQLPPSGPGREPDTEDHGDEMDFETEQPQETAQPTEGTVQKSLKSKFVVDLKL